MTELVKAIHQIHHVKPGDKGEWRETPEGKILIARKPESEIVQPGQLFIPHTAETLAELRSLGAVVEPDEGERAIYERTDALAKVAPVARRGRPAKSADDSADDLVG